MAHIHKVLIVEDIRFHQALLTEILGPAHEIRVASDGEEGINIACAWKPDLIFMDLSLPKVDGLEAIRRVRAKLGIRTRIVALSATSDPERIAGAMAAGADAWLPKPFNNRTVGDLMQKFGGTIPPEPTAPGDTTGEVTGPRRVAMK